MTALNMALNFPPRSGYETVGGIVMFGRTLDKIRLHKAGLLPKDYNLGHGLDGRGLPFFGRWLLVSRC